VSKSLIFLKIGLACCGAALVLPLTGCANPGCPVQSKTLVIRWQRLVNETGETCGRCGDTERAIDQAQRQLATSLKPLGLRVQVVKTRLTAEQFRQDATESNRIWIGEKPLETILDAKTGVSTCSGFCGGSSCRTTVVDGKTYEVIPPELIVRAGLRMAADLVEPAPPPGACCPSDQGPSKSDATDLQPMPWLSR
jgi:hypothetical protein